MTDGAHMKPYPEYKDSGVEWLGEVPGHWTLVPGYKCWKEGRESNQGLKNNNVLSLSYGRIVRRDVDLNMGLLPASFETYQVIHPGDIILRLTDLQNDKRSLRVGQVKEDGIITSAYVCLRTKGCCAEYIYRLLHSYDTTKVFYNIGGGVRQGMKYDDVKRLPIVLPPLPEQEKIAAFLDYETGRMDKLIEKQEKLIELLKEKRQAVISHAVTKGLNPDAPMKDSGVEWLGEVPAHWGVTRVKMVADVRGGLALGKGYGDAELIEYPYLRVANVQDGYLVLDEIATVAVPATEALRNLLRAGDVLMNEGGDADKLGRGCVWRGEIDPCLHQNHVFSVRPIGINAEWLNVWTSTQAAKRYFESRSKQSTNLASISATNIGELYVPVPPVEEQEAIVTHIEKATSRIDELISAAGRSMELSRERRTALISAAVTGKIDVRGWNPPEKEVA